MIKIEEHQLNRLQMISKIIGVLSFAAFLVLIGLGAWQLIAINRKVDDAEKNLALKNDEINKKLEQIDKQEAKIRENADRIEAQNQLLKSIPTEYIDLAFENNPEAAKSLPRVYLHIGEEAQRELAVKLQKKLQAEGYIVPSIQNVKGVARVPAKTELRYCEGRGQDSDINEIKDLLTADGVDLSIHAPLKTPGCINVNYNRNYELWLKNNPKENIPTLKENVPVVKE